MEVVLLHAVSNIEHILIEEINRKLVDWESKNPGVEIVSVNQMITLVPNIGCPDLFLTLVIVYRRKNEV